MSQENTTDVLSLGFNDVDRLFADDGFPYGSVGLVKSDKVAETFSIFLSLIEANAADVSYFTNQKSRWYIVEELSKRGVQENDVKQIKEMHDCNSCDKLVEKIQEQNIGKQELVIIDSVEDFESNNDIDFDEMLRELKRFGYENNTTILVHYMMDDVIDGHIEHSSMEYIADFSMSISTELASHGVVKTWWFEKTPRGVRFIDEAENNQSYRIEEKTGLISINTGGAI